jgi:hypothetical protein
MSDSFLQGLVIASCIVAIIGFGVDVYVKYWVLPKVEELLANCPVVIDAKKSWDHSGFIGRRYRLVAVNLALTSTELLHSQGLLNMEEVQRVPINLRRWICTPDTIALVSFIAGMAALALLGKLW